MVLVFGKAHGLMRQDAESTSRERIPLFAWLLNLVYVALLAAFSPVILFRIVARGKYRTGWSQKLLGRVPPRDGDRSCLWFHAVSVGEVLQLEPLLEALSQHDPRLEFVISTTTPTGYDVAMKRYPGRKIIYFPLDFSWAVNAALARINPTAIVLVELELWPNFVFAAARRSIPIVLVNGRISERSFRGYRRILPLMRAILKKISVLAVQSDAYAWRLIDLGADPARIHVTGSIKFDRVETDRDNPRTAALRRLFGLQEAEQRVFIAGSTQAPEERYALETYLQLLPQFPDLRLVLVPRHKERFDEVAKLVTDEFKLPLIRRSHISIDAPESSPSPRAGTAMMSGGPRGSALPSVILLDTLGELSACWGLADIAFVGGSLTTRGGQNMIEPAGYGAAVLIGPNTWNFKDVVELLLSHEAALVVNSAAELTAKLNNLLTDSARAADLGNRGRKIVTAQRGATSRTVELIRKEFPGCQDSGASPEFRAA
ncbi:MAG: 3-deoxy-D-manno-octulosonic acid transferase [Deltaproteobacteria bacterium]